MDHGASKEDSFKTTKDIFLALLAPLTAFAIYISVLNFVFETQPVSNFTRKIGLSGDLLFEQASFLFEHFATMFAFVALSALIIIYSGATIYRAVNNERRWINFMALTVFGILVVICSGAFCRDSLFVTYLGEDMFRRLLAEKYFTLFMSLRQVADGTSALLALSLALSVWLTSSEYVQEKDSEKLLKLRGKVDLLLRLSGVALALAVIMQLIWMSFPAKFFLGSSDVSANYLEMANALTFYCGVSFSILIAAIFLPPYLIMYRHTAGLRSGGEYSAKKADGETPVEIGNPPILPRSPWSPFKGLLAILAPALAGAAPQLIANMLAVASAA